MNLLEKYAPRTITDLAGQPVAVGQLLSYASGPYPAGFIFHGPTGVGKSCAAKALALDLGCTDDEMGGLHEIPSGKQDGRAVDELLRALRMRPFYGSGWKCAIINEADLMTTQAEAIWLDGLEHLPPKTTIVLTTNRIQSLSARLVGRCEVVEFDGQSDDFLDGMAEHIGKIWKAETGHKLRSLPRNLGRFELGSDDYSLRLALQQIAPYIRSGEKLPEEFKVPFVRGVAPPKKRPDEVAEAKSAEAAKAGPWWSKGSAVCAR